MVEGVKPSNKSKVGSMATGIKPPVAATKVVKLAGLAAREVSSEKKEQIKYEICNLSTTDEHEFKASLFSVLIKYMDKPYKDVETWIKTNF